MRRVTILLGLAALLLSGCSTDSDPESAGDPPTEEPAGDESSSAVASTTTTVADGSGDRPVPAVPEVGRLVVIDDEGRAVSLAPDGSDPVVLADAAEVPFQPIWSPDSSRVAYANQSARPELVVTDADGANVRRAALDNPAFYLSWSPDGERVGALRNGTDAVALDVVDLDGSDPEAVELDQGAPYWLSWDPDGDRLAAHVGTDRLDVVGVDGEISSLGLGPGTFRVPDWTDAGLVAVGAEGGRQALVRIAPDGTVEVLAAVDGSVAFSVSPDGTEVALQSFAPEDEGAGEVIEAALPAQEPLPTNDLVVLDLETGEVTVVSLEDVLAFFWSPVGGRLLVLSEADGALRWRVWDGETLIDGPTFQPGASFAREFLAFFDQYERSMSLWAPDGSGYAFPGRIDDEDGIWLADPTSGAATKVAEGSWVAWSPT